MVARLHVALGTLATLIVALSFGPKASFAADDDTLARVRASGFVRCAGIVRPGIAVPTVDGKHWYGIAPDICRAVAAGVFGDASRMRFRPYFEGKKLDGSPDTLDDIVFVSGSQLVGEGASGAAPLELGPVIAHDALALLVPAGGAAGAAQLAGKTICVEPGTPADRALIRYFDLHRLQLNEHPFQEPDEMRQAYADGNCAAVAGPLTTLASVRADPQDGHRADRILPERLADDPIFAASPADARWLRIVSWTFSALVDAESAGIDGRDAAAAEAIPGVPPAVGRDLGLRAHWAQNAVAAGGNYGELFDQDLGAASQFHLARTENALWQNGGLIYGLSVE